MNMVTTPESTTNSTWLAIRALFCDNKDVCIIELDIELHLMTMGDNLINDYYEKMKVTADILNNIDSPIPEHTLVAYFLDKLPPKVNHIVTNSLLSATRNRSSTLLHFLWWSLTRLSYLTYPSWVSHHHLWKSSLGLGFSEPTYFLFIR